MHNKRILPENNDQLESDGDCLVAVVCLLTSVDFLIYQVGVPEPDLIYYTEKEGMSSFEKSFPLKDHLCTLCFEGRYWASLSKIRADIQNRFIVSYTKAYQSLTHRPPG